MVDSATTESWQAYVDRLSRKASEAYFTIMKTSSDEECLQWMALIEAHKRKIVEGYADEEARWTELKTYAAVHVLIGSTPRESFAKERDLKEHSIEQFYQDVIDGTLKPPPPEEWSFHLLNDWLRLKRAEEQTRRAEEAAREVVVREEPQQGFREMALKRVGDGLKKASARLRGLHRK